MSITKKYSVKPINSDQTYDWLLHKHYAKRIPSISYAFGLFNIDNILQGVITYGTPVSSTLRSLWKDEYKLIELNRLVINDNLEKNSLSFLVSQSLNMLPKPLIIVSYADSSQNHHGYIYQATNWIYTGLSIPFKDYFIEGLEHMHHGTIYDLSRGKKNRTEWLKEKFGDKLIIKERSRKHRYFYFLANKRDKKNIIKMLPYEILPYPKGENKKYDSSFKPEVQLNLF